MTEENKSCTDEVLVFCGAAEDLVGAIPQPVAWDSAARERESTSRFESRVCGDSHADNVAIYLTATGSACRR